MLKENQLVLFGQGIVWRYQLEQPVLSSADMSTPSNRIFSLSDIDYANKRVLFSVFKDTKKDLVMFQP